MNIALGGGEYVILSTVRKTLFPRLCLRENVFLRLIILHSALLQVRYLNNVSPTGSYIPMIFAYMKLGLNSQVCVAAN